VIARSLTTLWSDRRIRYLFVGGFNTACAYVVYSVIFHFLSLWLTCDPRVVADLASLLCNIPNLTIAYFMNKFLVFRTRGNYLREYFRSYLVYAIPMTSNLIILPVIMTFTARWFGRFTGYAAQAIIIILTVIATYFGHKHVTFRLPAGRGEIQPPRRQDAKEENTRNQS
jgi:putative flippase GtrA